MMLDMIAAFDATDADDAVRVVIVTGAGRGFCAGADLSAGGATFDRSGQVEPSREETRVDGVLRDGGGRLTLRIYESLKPVIAAVNGPAVGRRRHHAAGHGHPHGLHRRPATASSSPAAASTPEAASSWFLPHLVGVQTALEWCYTGRVFPASEALERGLVRSLHEPDDLLPAARALAREIADNTAPVSVALTRQMIWRMAGAEHPMDAHRADSRGIQARGAPADVREGVTSFLEKRPAVYPEPVSTDLPDIWPDWSPPEFG